MIIRVNGHFFEVGFELYAFILQEFINGTFTAKEVRWLFAWMDTAALEEFMRFMQKKEDSDASL